VNIPRGSAMLKNRNFKSCKLLFVILLLLLLSSAMAQNFDPRRRMFFSDYDYSSPIEKRIRAGKTSTAALIVDSHPRLWMRGNWDWNKDNVGSFAWRIVHGPAMDKRHSANDQQKYEFCYIFRAANYSIAQEGYYSKRFLYTIIAAEAVARDSEWHFPRDLPSTSNNPDYEQQYTENDFLARAKKKLLERSATKLGYEGPYERCVEGAVGYDWLVNRKFSDGVTPVLSESDRRTIQKNLIAQAEYLRSKADGSEQLFNGGDISNYVYVMVGLALYEPSGKGISTENNAKAKQYLNEFDKYWIGKILPALNEQGGTGGWHGGLCNADKRFNYKSRDAMLTYLIAPILFAHYTATGQSYENSVFSTGALKYAAEFQNYMVYPDGEYLAIGEQKGKRFRWIAPMFPVARRRFSSDPEQQWLGELAGWLRNEIAPGGYVNAGSWDMFDQLMWEQKYPNPRSADDLGCGTRHFAKLGWVAMRSGFTSPDDVAALFICQRYHWSHLDPYAQNSFNLERKGKLIEGFQNTIRLNDQYQRRINGFPSITEGVAAYAPGSKYDIGPGIQVFKTTDQYDYVVGDATKAYDQNKLAKFTRSVVWLKSKNIFVMFDRVVTKKSGVKKSWIIDPVAAPQLKDDKLYKISNGAGALWIKRILPDQVTETMNDGMFKVTPVKLVRETYFLHVLQAVDASLSKVSSGLVADDARIITTENRMGVKVDGCKVLFGKTTNADVIVDFAGL